MTSGKIISENKKRLHNKFGLTQDYLVKKANINNHYYKVESGTVNKLSVQIMVKITKTLEISVDDLIK